MHLCRKWLRLKCWMNLTGHVNSHPTKKVMQVCWEIKETVKPSVGRIWVAVKDLGVYVGELCPMVLWVLEPLAVDSEGL